MTPELKILTAAREKIESGEDDYICDALYQVGVNLNLRVEAEALREVISAGITLPGNTKPEWSLADWVLQTYGTDMTCPALMAGNEIARLARLAWLDRLVQDRL